MSSALFGGAWLATAAAPTVTAVFADLIIQRKNGGMKFQKLKRGCGCGILKFHALLQKRGINIYQQNLISRTGN